MVVPAAARKLSKATGIGLAARVTETPEWTFLSKRNTIHLKEIGDQQPEPVVVLDKGTDQTSAGFLLSV